MSLLTAALDLVERGWWIFPLCPKSKTPLTKNGFHAASNQAEQIKRWWAAFPDANIGLVPGRSGLLVIDIDGPAAEARALELGINLDSTLAVRTGRTEGGIIRSLHATVYSRRPSNGMASAG